MTTDFVDEILTKLDNKENLTDREFSKLVYNYSINEENQDWGRWTMGMYTVAKLKDRYFSINWEQGLTESQDDCFYEQPVEVLPHTYEKTVTVTEWIPIKEENS